MPEAVIVATARSPIGRANKGSLVDVRPDDLSPQIVKALLAKVPAARPARPSRTSSWAAASRRARPGFNIARVVAVLAGLDDVPGVTVNRYCSSSLQTIRMAAHAIKAGEGDVFIAAGVETVSRYGAGRQRHRAEPVFSRRRRAHRRAGAAAGSRRGRRRRACPTSTSPWARPPRTCVEFEDVSREEMDEFASARRTAPSPPSRERLLRPTRSRRSRCPTAPSCRRTTAPAPAPPLEGLAGSSRCSAPTARSPPATPARSTTAPPPCS